MLKSGAFLFFLDGYDEIAGEHKKSITEGINNFIEKYSENRFMLTTRPYSDIGQIPLFHNYRIEQLSNNNGDIDRFIDKQLKDEPELASQIKKSIKDTKSDYINSFLVNPLLLSLYILTYQSNASVPTKKYVFYRRVINALFSEHDSKSKLGFEREKKCNLQQEDFEKILKAFCFISYFDNKFSFEFDDLSSRLDVIRKGIANLKFSNNHFIHDMKVAISLWTEDGGVISFAHRSLQEYFAALFIKDLDDQNKEKVYMKVLKHSENIRTINEIRNFLSLCEEMDEANFNKHYAIPILKEIQSAVTGRNPLNKFLGFFANGVVVIFSEDKPTPTPYRHYASVNEAVYKSIYFHFPFTIKLNNEISKININEIFPNGVPTDQEVRPDTYRLSFAKTKGLKKNLVDALMKSSAKKLAEKLLTFLEKDIEKRENLIEKQEKSNQNFIAMIQ